MIKGVARRAGNILRLTDLEDLAISWFEQKRYEKQFNLARR